MENGVDSRILHILSHQRVGFVSCIGDSDGQESGPRDVVYM